MVTAKSYHHWENGNLTKRYTFALSKEEADKFDEYVATQGGYASETARKIIMAFLNKQHNMPQVIKDQPELLEHFDEIIEELSTTQDELHKTKKELEKTKQELATVTEGKKALTRAYVEQL